MAARQGGDVAIKMVHAHLLSNAEVVERLRREADALASLEHPHIVKVHDVVEEGGRAAIVMEWVPGRPLSRVIGTETGPVPWERASAWVRPMLDAVAHAHARGVIHRDVKPENMVITRDGVLKLLDFGIARLDAARDRTRTGTRMGTLDYMAPEQFLDAGAVDARADVYALGLTVYEMVAGRLPWDANTPEYEVMRQKERGALVAPTQFYPSIPPWVVDAVMAALVPEVASRTQTVTELADALRGEARAARPAPRTESSPLTPGGPQRQGGATKEPSSGRNPGDASREMAPSDVDPSGRPLPVARVVVQKDVVHWDEVVVDQVLTGDVEDVREEVEVRPATPFAKAVREVRVNRRPVVREVRRLVRKEGERARLVVRDDSGKVGFDAELVSVGTAPFVMGDGFARRLVKLKFDVEFLAVPVTQELYQLVTGHNPSGFKGVNRPVECVSWDDAVSFCNELSRLQGVAPAYRRDASGKVRWPDGHRPGWRLPTAAEWECACRAGTTGETYGDLDDIAWFERNAGARTRAVRSKQPNAWGLYDMLGNVWEWVWDADGDQRLNCGGAWGSSPSSVRAGHRGTNRPDQRFNVLGFRIVRTKPGVT
jgi:hypothetical protein